MSRTSPVEITAAPDRGYVTIRVDWYRIVFAAVLVFTVVTRFYGLSLKPFHHDESLYSTYSWYLYDGRGYKYDPMMHGPFMFYLDALLFTLFGISDFVARMSSALFGVGVVWCAWLFRKELGKAGSLSAAILYAVSPTFMYFSRFFREDIFVAFWALLSVALYVNWLRERGRGWLYGSAAAFALMFCVKENSYMFMFIFVTFGVFMLLFERLFGRDEAPAGPDSPAPGEGRLIGPLDALVSLGIFFAIFYLFFTSFFHNMPGFIDGLYRKSLGYWMYQDRIQRIKGPFTYFCPLAATYELPLLAVLFAGIAGLLARRRLSRIVMVVSTAVALPLMLFWNLDLPVEPWDKIFHMTSTLHIVFALYVFVIGMAATCTYLKEGRRLAAFLSYWSWMSILLYSYAGEKVPWLLMHALMPMVLWAALILGGFLESERFLRRTGLYAALLGAGLLLFLQASLRLCFVNEANPVECMVYTQTSADIQKTLRIIAGLAEETGKGFQFPMGIQGESTWPYTWYLRDYKDWFHPGVFTAPSKMVVAVDWDKRKDFSAVLEPHYRETRIKLREWWVPSPLSSLKNPERGWAERVFGRSPFSVFIADASYRMNALAQYYFGRKVWSILGSQDIAFYVRKDLLGDKSGPSPDEVAEAPARKALVIPKDYAIIGEVSPERAFGERGSSKGRFDEPRGIWADASGAIYVADTKNQRWQKFDGGGKLILCIGGPGSGASQFKEPMGIAVDGEGFVYVSDTWNHRIQKFDREGKFVKEWEGGAGGFWAPKGMAFDREGNLYVADTGRHRVQKFTRDGKPLLVWGEQGEGPGEFKEPVGIAIHPDGVITPADEAKKQREVRGEVVYVTDTANKRVQKFDTKGMLLGQFGVLGWEEYYTEPFVAVDAAGRVWVTDSRNNRVEIFSPEGTLLALWSAKGFKPGNFNTPIGIFISDGRVYVSDTYNYRVQVFSEKKVYRK